MKTILATIIFAMSVSAEASEATFSKEAVELLSITSQCAAEMGVLGKRGQVSEATHEEKEDLDIYTIKFTGGGYAPFFQRYSVGKLEIHRTFVRSRIMAPDAPGGKMVYRCNLTIDR